VSGSINRAVEEVGEILKIRGVVLPITLTKTKLMMKLCNGKVLRGENAIAEYLLVSKLGIKELRLTPTAKLNPKARKAIAEADLVVLGPGNLYSSLVPNLLVQGLPQALKRTKAPVVFVANLMNKIGHTDDFTCTDYVEELERHAGMRLITHVLYNTASIPRILLTRYVDEGEPVLCTPAQSSKVAYLGRDLLPETMSRRAKGDPLRRTLIRHDPVKLATAVMSFV